ncbi:MAG: DUF1573 domain-containing protein [Patescibacteria group bacterium]
MKTKNIIVFFLLLVGLFGLMWWGRPAQTSIGLSAGAGSATSKLTTPEPLYDFGTISMADGNVSKVFTVTNSTNQELKVESVVTSCMCTTAYLGGPTGEKGPFGMPGHGGPVAKANEVIKAGESREIRVVYDPAAHGPAGIGPVDRFIYLTETSGGTLALEIKAVVTP